MVYNIEPELDDFIFTSNNNVIFKWSNTNDEEQLSNTCDGR
jgi:hypothetical protein